jgi:hypothetical protein
MSTPRSEHTATLLPDGTVLIVGGYLFSGATVATTELYDPVSGTFSTGREMVTSRCCHTATLLNDGRVLIAGGNTAISTLNSGSPTPLAELYTPEVLKPAPVLLSTDGRGQGAILQAGTARLVTASDPAVEGEGLAIYCNGFGGRKRDPSASRHGRQIGLHPVFWECSGFPESEPGGYPRTYDPSSGIFSATGNMTTARGGHTATLLADGKVLITGGFAAIGSGSASNLATAELYDPAAGTFTPTGNMIQGRAVHAATLMGNGKVLVAGNGYTETSYVAELYDPLTQTFSSLGQLSINATQLTLLANGNVLVQGADSSGRLSAVIYDPIPARSARRARRESLNDFPPRNAGLLINGKVLDIDLDDGCGDPTNVAGIYEPSADTFATETMTAWPERLSHDTLGRYGLIAGGGTALAFGRWVPQPGLKSTIPLQTDSSVTGSLAGSREDPTATLLPDGTVLVAGGWRYGAGSVADAEIYHPNVTVPAPVLLPVPGNIPGGRRNFARRNAAVGYAGQSRRRWRSDRDLRHWFDRPQRDSATGCNRRTHG